MRDAPAPDMICKALKLYLMDFQRFNVKEKK